jgi:hypothetical protein
MYSCSRYELEVSGQLHAPAGLDAVVQLAARHYTD